MIGVVVGRNLASPWWSEGVKSDLDLQVHSLYIRTVKPAGEGTTGCERRARNVL